jgi:putative membrane protein
MSDEDDTRKGRRPSSFSVQEGDASGRTVTEAPRRSPRSFQGGVLVTPEADDPFLSNDPDLATDATAVALPRPRRRFSFLNLAVGAFGTFLSLAFGLWADGVVRDLFARADWLGYAALTALGLGLAAVLIMVGREIYGMMRLTAVQTLKASVEAATVAARPAAARTCVTALTKLLGHRPETARGRAALDATADEIIDAPQLIELAERELLSPLDRKARSLILGSSQRVAIVTAVSPRAIVDLAFVLLEVSRLIRAMADLYGGRPGTLGLLRLMRDVIAHLAVTGSIAVGDGLAQQLLGHGLASRLSSRLGEGVINGLLTARIGIAAMDLCRPMPFRALKRPGMSDFMSDIVAAGTGKRPD